MKKLVLLVWLMLPVLVGFYHFGPGQEKALLDSLNMVLAEADRNAADQAWGPAETQYEIALTLLPSDRILVYVKAHQGCGARDIARSMRSTPNGIRLAIHGLLADRKLRTEVVCLDGKLRYSIKIQSSHQESSTTSLVS